MTMHRWINRLGAVCLAGLVAVSIASCRKEKETILSYHDPAATSGEKGDITVDIPAGLYLCFLIQADGEARSAVDEAQEEASSTASEVDYYAQKVEDKEFSTWVVDRAQQLAANYAALMIWEDQFGLQMTDDQQSAAEYYADYYWSQMGSFYESNGVAESTYKTFYEATSVKAALFDYYYGEGGELQVSDADLKTGLQENYVLANTIQWSFTDEDGNEASDDEKKEMKSTLDGYVTRLNAGESFAAVKAAYEEVTGTQQEKQEAATEAATEQSTDAYGNVVKNASPQDPNASVFAGDETSSPSSYYAMLAELENGKAEVLEFDDCYMLAVRKDILSDPYYFDELKESVRALLKGDELEEKIEEFAKTLTVTKNESAIQYYAPKKIDYGTAAA